MDESDLQNTLKYKFMKSLNKKVNDNNLLAKAVMKSMISLHDNFGDKKSENAAEELRNKLENDERNKIKVKNIIKNAINTYKEKCSSSLTEENQIDMIIVLLDYILKKVDGQSNDDLMDSLKYIKKITLLSCNISSQEHKVLISEYTKYLLKNKKDERNDFLLELFSKFK